MDNKEQDKIPLIPQWCYWVFAALIILFITKVTDVIVPFIISAVIACFLNIFAEFFQNKGVKRGPAVTISILACTLIIISSLFFIIPPLIGQVYQLHKTVSSTIIEIHKAGIKKQNESLKIDTEQPNDIKYTVSAYITGLYEKYPEIKSIIGEEPEIRNLLKTKQQEIANSIFGFINDAINNATNFFSHVFYIVLMPIFTCYFLIIIPDLKKRFNYVLSKNAYGVQIKDIILRIIDVVSNYIRGMFIVMVVYGTAIGIGCWAMSLFSGAKYSLIIGVAAGILCVIPYIGQAAIYILAAGIIYSTSGNLMATVISVPVIFSINFISDNYISPKIVGNQTGLHPLVAMFAMLSVGKVFGFWGMILGVPMAGAVKIIMMQLYPVLFETIEEKDDSKSNIGEESKQTKQIKKRIKISTPEEDKKFSLIRIPVGDDSESPFTINETKSENHGPEIMRLKTFKAITKSLLPPKTKTEKKDIDKKNKILPTPKETKEEINHQEKHDITPKLKNKTKKDRNKKRNTILNESKEIIKKNQPNTKKKIAITENPNKSTEDKFKNDNNKPKDNKKYKRQETKKNSNNIKQEFKKAEQSVITENKSEETFKVSSEKKKHRKKKIKNKTNTLKNQKNKQNEP